MNKAEETFLVILKDAIHPGSEPSELPSQDWKSIFNIAKKQNLFPFVYDVATNYLSFADFDSSNPQYFASATTSMTMQMQKTERFIELYQAFLSAGMAPITMKGIICRSLYGERADLRPSGDEDILIEKKDYEKAVEVLESCGYRSKEKPDRALSAVQEITFCSSYVSGKPVLVIEMHLNPFGTESVLQSKMNRWFKNAFRDGETVSVQNTPIRTMTHTNHFLFLVFHAFKHFIAEGFGVRMMLDILLFAEKYNEKIDWRYIENAIDDIGARSFLSDLMFIGNEYLNFHFIPICASVSPNDLLDDMFRTGTFGNATGIDRTAGRFVANTVWSDDKRGRKYTSYLRLLFPSWKTWTAWKPYLSDKPWLLPFEWFMRIVRFLRGKTSTSSLSEIDKSYEIAEDRLSLLNKYRII